MLLWCQFHTAPWTRITLALKHEQAGILLFFPDVRHYFGLDQKRQAGSQVRLDWPRDLPVAKVSAFQEALQSDGQEENELRHN
jgi:hypothetical protein